MIVYMPPMFPLQSEDRDVFFQRHRWTGFEAFLSSSVLSLTIVVHQIEWRNKWPIKQLSSLPLFIECFHSFLCWHLLTRFTGLASITFQTFVILYLLPDTSLELATLYIKLFINCFLALKDTALDESKFLVWTILEIIAQNLFIRQRNKPAQILELFYWN